LACNGRFHFQNSLFCFSELKSRLPTQFRHNFVTIKLVVTTA
jgi:hypothetical protein